MSGNQFFYALSGLCVYRICEVTQVLSGSNILVVFMKKGVGLPTPLLVFHILGVYVSTLKAYSIQLPFIVSTGILSFCCFIIFLKFADLQGPFSDARIFFPESS